MSQRKSLTQAHIKAVFLSDIRGKFKKCQICSREFGFTRAEHQCKRCLRAVCEKCSNNKIVHITEAGPSKRPRRVCDICKEESQWIRRFVEQQKVSIGVDTFANEWLKASGLSVDMAKQEYEKVQQEQQLNKDKGEFLRMKQELQAAMIELWLNLNFSFREFLSYMLKESEHENVTQKVSRVLGALLIQYPDIGYNSDQVLITLFLLCFASEASAYALLTILYSEVIPFNTYPAQLRKYPYDYTSEVDKVIQVMEQAFKMKQTEAALIKPFIRNKIARYLQPVGINFFLFQTSFFFINQTLLNPKNGYDNILKCLASAFYIRFEEIKHFPSSFDEAESQLLKGVLSGDLEKSFLSTKLIIFLSHNHGMTQSVIINRPLETKQVVHQIKIEHTQDQKTQRKIEQEEDMLKYTVIQDNEFQTLRRKTIQVQVQPQVDEEKANLRQYIEKVEEALMLKHKLVVELQNRIKELQNQPPQIVNQDADKQLLHANEQLRIRIAAQDQEIFELQEQKKYSDKLQEESQEIINNLQRSNSELSEQLTGQITLNTELQLIIKDLKNQSEQQSMITSTSSPQVEKNYQININVQSRHTEDQLLLKLEEERQRIFNLEISNNQMNKEYIALQQLNQDKLRIIGNLEVRLIQAEAAKKDRERYYLEIVEIKKKLEGHELAIIHQQEQYDQLQRRYNQLLVDIELLRKEKLALQDQLSHREGELQLIITTLRSQLTEFQTNIDSITIQLNQSLQINQKLQSLIIEKDHDIEQLNIKIKLEIKRYEELHIQFNLTIEEHKRILSEKELLIVNFRQGDASLRDELLQLRRELEEKSQLLIKIQIEFDTQRQNSSNYESKYLVVFNELDQFKNQFHGLNQTHLALVETHRLTVIELDNWKNQHSALLLEHQKLTEKHRLVIVELDDYKVRWTTLQQEHHALSEKHRLIIIEFNTVNERCLALTNQQNQQSQQHGSLIIELTSYKDQLSSITGQYNSLNEKHTLVVLELNTLREKHGTLTLEHNQLTEKHRLIVIEFQTLNERHTALTLQHNQLSEKHRLIVIEFQTLNERYGTLTLEHNQLSEKHRLIVIEFQTLNERYGTLTLEHNQLSEKHRLIVIEFQTLNERHLTLISQHNELSEQHRLIVIQFNTVQQSVGDYQEKIRIIEELRLQLSQFEEKYNLLVISNKSLNDRIELDIQIHLKRVTELELIIVGLEKKILELNNNHESLRITIQQYITRITVLEQEKQEADQKYQSYYLQISVHTEKLTLLEQRNTELELLVVELQKNNHELSLLSQNQKGIIIQLEERIVILVAEQTKVKELLVIIETQKVQIVDYEELIRRLKAQIVDQEKQIAKLKLTLKQFKELSTELAQID